MKNRLLTAAIALPILIVSIVLPDYFPTYQQLNWIFICLAAAAIGAGLFEFYRLTKKLELKADASMAFLGSALLFIAFLFDAPAKAPELLLITIALFFMGLLITQTFRFQKDFSKMLTGVGVTMVGVLYIAFLGGYLVSLRVGFETIPGLSTKLLGYFFLVVMGSDVGAYYVGKGIGKHKLIPKISPNKTWEGFVGGLLLATGFAALATFWFFPELPYRVSIPREIVMALIGVAGSF